MPDQEFDVSQEFVKSKLASKSILFTNDVGMFLIKQKKSNYETINECIHSANMCNETLPDDCNLELSAIQFIIKSPKELDKKTLGKLSNYGFLFRHSHESIDENDNPIYHTTVLQQQPENFDSDFEEFLDIIEGYCKHRKIWCNCEVAINNG